MKLKTLKILFVIGAIAYVPICLILNLVWIIFFGQLGFLGFLIPWSLLTGFSSLAVHRFFTLKCKECGARYFDLKKFAVLEFFRTHCQNCGRSD